MSASSPAADTIGTQAQTVAPTGPPTDVRMLAWMVGYLRPHVAPLGVAVLAMVGGSAADIIPPAFMRRIVDDVVVGRDFGKLASSGVGLLAALVTSSLLSGVHQIVTRRLAQRIVHRMRMDLHRHLQGLSLGFFERQRTGDIMSRVSSDVNETEAFLGTGIANIITDVLCLVGILGMMFWISAPLALLALAPVPLFLLGTVAYAAYLRPLYRRIRDRLGAMNAVLHEGIVGIRVVRAFGREDHEEARFGEASGRLRDESIRAQTLSSVFFPFSALLVSSSVLLVVWIGVSTTRAPELQSVVTAGTITAFVAYLQQFYWRLGDLLRVYTVHTRTLAAAARILEVLSERPSVCDAPGALELGEIEGHVLLDSVSFRYPTGELVLRDVSLEAHPGEMIALVGRSEAGKTTLVNLIARFHDPTAGCVLVDGHDLRAVTQGSLRAQVAMVLQETFLFGGTVRENIAYGRPDATDEEIVAAAVAGNAEEFIGRLPQGYDTEIGERGVRLSGGQAQRLAIARALLADPRILILDEATSQVDAETESEIQAALQNLTRDRTSFVIAHRLSTIKRADRITVIEDGSVVEEGPHEALLAAGGPYAELHSLQFV